MTSVLTGRPGWPSILLARAGAADPVDLDAAVKAGAFEGLRRAVRDLGPGGTINELATAGLRGRGGAGYPAADKWAAAAGTDAPGRVAVANGYGADPTSTTDRTLLEVDPYAVLEGLAIAALTIGADEGIVAVRADAALVISRLEAAIGAATAAGFLGDDVLGSGRALFVRVAPVQGAYLLGEETVLLRALEGKRGQAEQRPPHPATSGFHGLPTVVQNVQTLAAAAWILRSAGNAAAFAAIGDPACPGTILVDVRGTRSGGVAEVPLGTPLRDIVALGGGPADGRSVKAVLLGGPSGGILPAEALDTPYTFAGLRGAGAHVGSGSVAVADDRACVVDLARVLTRWCSDEACGKTIPCRIGLKRLSEIADRLAAGTSRAGDLGLLGDLAADVRGSALCDHERLATLPLLTGMRYFQAELDAHVERGSCPAGVCHPTPMATAGTL